MGRLREFRRRPNYLGLPHVGVCSGFGIGCIPIQRKDFNVGTSDFLVPLCQGRQIGRLKGAIRPCWAFWRSRLHDLPFQPDCRRGMHGKGRSMQRPAGTLGRSSCNLDQPPGDTIFSLYPHSIHSILYFCLLYRCHKKCQNDCRKANRIQPAYYRKSRFFGKNDC